MSPIVPSHQFKSIVQNALRIPTPVSYGSTNSKDPTLEPTPPLPTSMPVFQRDGSWSYLTLSITYPYTTYTTTILLGNSIPSQPPSTSPASTFSSESQTQPQSQREAVKPGIATGTIVGIVVGCITGFLLLVGIFYLYLLRARQHRRRRRRSRRRSKSRSSSGAGGGNAGKLLHSP